MERNRLGTVLATCSAGVFAVQFVALDAVIRGPRAWFQSAVAPLFLVVSVLVWMSLLGLGRRRRVRIALALFAAMSVVVHAFVFRYYRTALDHQVAASAFHAWRDVLPIVVRASPYVVLATAGAFVVELALLELAHRGGAPRGWGARLTGRRYSRVGVLAAATALVFLAPRQATPDLAGLHALTAVAHARAAPAPFASATAATLPPIHSDRDEIPSVLFVLTESVRADDYATEGSGATARETTAVLANASRLIELREMRAVSSYTALSVSALMSGWSQEGGRDEILRSPSLFDVAHAVVDARGRRGRVSYYGSQSADVFESEDVRRHADPFVTVETILGRPVGDERTLDGLPLDRQIVDRLLVDLPSLAPASFVMLHLYATHAPYFFEDARASFVPFDRVVAWSSMRELRNASRNAIVEQDRQLARAVRAFIEHNRGRPWIVLFTSDHGEAFGEHGAIHHGQSLYDEQIHVPAWIAFGGAALDTDQERALTDHQARFVTHLDIVPTFLDALGVWDNLTVLPLRQRLRGRSLLRPWEARAPIPVTNCTAMFPCPLDTWGELGSDHKLIAQRWDAGWICLDLRGGERAVPRGDPACLALEQESRHHFPRLPSGGLNR